VAACLPIAVPFTLPSLLWMSHPCFSNSMLVLYHYWSNTKLIRSCLSRQVWLGTLLRVSQGWKQSVAILWAFLEALEKNPFPSSFRQVMESVFCRHGTEVVVFLIAVSWGVTLSCHRPLSGPYTWLTIAKSVAAHWILLRLGISDFFYCISLCFHSEKSPLLFRVHFITLGTSR
jgi:hypothetical protein